MTSANAAKPIRVLANACQERARPSGECWPGGNKRQAKFIQERLCLANFNVAIDSDFGSATEQQIKNYQASKGLPQTGVYGMAEHDGLTKPFVNAINPFGNPGSAFGDVLVKVARRHCAQRPVEAGGDNRGPWVRMYMDGKEGTEWKWCAGFVFFAIAQTCDILGQPLPMSKTFTVDTVVSQAKAAGLFMRESQAATPAGKARILPGSLFAVRASPVHWSHLGIVSRASADSFATMEGNTNDEGSADGFEAVERVRGYGSKDFVIW